jgi:hypothetical protein
MCNRVRHVPHPRGGMDSPEPPLPQGILAETISLALKTGWKFLSKPVLTIVKQHPAPCFEPLAALSRPSRSTRPDGVCFPFVLARNLVKSLKLALRLASCWELATRLPRRTAFGDGVGRNAKGQSGIVGHEPGTSTQARSAGSGEARWQQMPLLCAAGRLEGKRDSTLFSHAQGRSTGKNSLNHVSHRPVHPPNASSGSSRGAILARIRPRTGGRPPPTHLILPIRRHFPT